jgi:hypothetical protein
VWYFFLRYVDASGGWRGDEMSFPPNPTMERFGRLAKVNKDYEEFVRQRWDSLNEASEEWGAR